MPVFDIRTETIHAEWWDADEFVTVKERNYADDQRAAQSIIKGRVTMETTELMRKKRGDAIDIDLAQHSIFEMLYSIEEWTLKDGKGKAVPLSFDAVSRLPDRDAQFIKEAIAVLNPSRDDEFPGDDGDDSPIGEGELPAGAIGSDPV